MASSRQEELQQELSRRKELESELASRKGQSQQSVQPSDGGIFNLGGGPPSDRSVMDVIRDLGAGLARGSQNLASAGLEAGEYLTRKGAERLGKSLGHPVKVPYWSAREFMGLEGPNKIDLGKMIEGQRPDPLSQAIGQFGPAIAAGGPNALRQMLTQAGYGATQASPEEKNLLGLLPSGRGGAAIESGALAGLPFAIPKLFGKAKNALSNLLSSESTRQNLLTSLGTKGPGEGLKTIPENIQELGKRLEYGQETAREEALTPKREIMSESGEQRIIPEQIKGKSLVNETSSIFAESPQDITPDKIKQYEKSLKQYYKDGDIDSLIESGEDIFNHPGLNEKDIFKLDQSLIPEKKLKGEYLKIKNPDEHYSEMIQDAHDNYVKNPTFRNSDKLRSRLFKRINELSKRQKAKTITDAQELELSSLTKNRNAIIKDQDKLIETFSPENQEKYGKFNKLWREDVRAYEEAGATIKNMKNRFLNNVTPQKITNAFSFPELKPQVQKVLKDIGPEGINNIIYNEVGRSTNAADALKILEGLERNKGFSPYITPEIRQLINKLRNQLRNQRLLKYGAGTTAIGSTLYGGYKGAQNIFGR